MRTIALALLTALAGCGTIMQPGPDMIPVASDPPGAKVYIGDAALPVAITPGIAAVPRNAGSFQGIVGGFAVPLRIKLDGYHLQTVMVEDVPNGWHYGNLIIGGLTGAIVDLLTHSSTKWPERPMFVRLTPLAHAAPAQLIFPGPGTEPEALGAER